MNWATYLFDSASPPSDIASYPFQPKKKDLKKIRKQLDIPVRVASPEGDGGLTDHLLTPQYATAIGLLEWAARVVTTEDLQRYEPPPRTQSWDRLREAVRRFFP